MRTVVAIAIAGVSTACTGSDQAPICEQAQFDECTSCAQDKDCDSASQRGEVCAPDMQCWPPSELQTVTVNWTIGGQPASAATCAGLPSELDVIFDNRQTLKPDTIDAGQVPCAVGMVVQDQVPPDLATVILGPGGQVVAQGGGGSSVTLDIPCVQDIAGGDVCSIEGKYLPASGVEAVRVTWTVSGQPASASTCAGSLETITVQLKDPNSSDAYGATVQCADGAFSPSKVPTDLQTVLIYGSSPDHLLGSATLANGSAAVDLMP
jgi:hypothetical protein